MIKILIKLLDMGKNGVFSVTSNGKNATNFFPHLIFLKQENCLKSNKDIIIFIYFLLNFVCINKIAKRKIAGDPGSIPGRGNIFRNKN